MFSHLSLVPGGLTTYIDEIGQEDCIKLHKYGTYNLANSNVIANITPNSTSSHSKVVAGVLNSGGACNGVTYTSGTNVWEKVIVMQAITITISDFISSVRLADNKILIRNNIVCPYLDGKCVDPEFGVTYWETVTNSSCEDSLYDVLWQGNATKIKSINNHTSNNNIVYTVRTEDTVFALEIKKTVPVCRFTGYQTEHPRLVIVPKVGSSYWFAKSAIDSKNLDILTYINSKFVYSEQHWKVQIKKMYINLLYKRCELEKEVLKTQMSIALHHPDEFALIYMKQLGFTAIPRGEIIYVLKCQPVEVYIRKTDKCYNELPVTYTNDSYFMTPKTHLIQKLGTEVPCSPLISPGFHILGEWYGFAPILHRIKTPNEIQPSTKDDWKYEEPGNLIKAGLYSETALGNLRRQAMFPSERQAIANIVTQRLLGVNIDHQDINTMNLLTPNDLLSLKDKISNIIQEIGTIYLIIIGIYAIIKFIKGTVNTGVNARNIYITYGWNWRLIASSWNTMANRIITRPQNNQARDQDAELTTITIHKNDQIATSKEDVGYATIRESLSKLDERNQTAKVYLPGSTNSH